MKKQEAIDFIREELTNGRTIKQISSELSIKLDAPKDVVEKFVKQTADELVAVDFLTSNMTQTQAPPPSIVTPFAEQQPVPEEIQVKPISEPLAPAAANPAAKPPPKVVTPPFIPEPEGFTPSPPYDFIPKPEFDEAALEKFILHELGRQRKQSDVVIRLCEATGMNWDQGQKIVARVAARNNKKLVANQNKVVIPLCIIALIAGLGLLFAGTSEAVTVQSALTDPASLSPDQLEYLYDSGRQLIWAFLIGLTLTVGGLVGLFMAIKKQMNS